MTNPETIKDWLAEQGKDRFWLAEKCGVSKNTVDGWLSNGRTISGPALIVIQELMNPGRPLTPVLDYGTWKKLEAKADGLRISLEAYVAEVLKREAARSDEETEALYKKPGR